MVKITNPLLIQVLSNNDTMLYGSRKGLKLEKNKYHNCCTSGPTGWYKQAGINLAWWNTKIKPVTYENSKHFLLNSGMIPVWHGTLKEIDALTSKNLRPGDIGTLYQGHAGRKSQHGMMWTGHDWRSDAIQWHANCEGVSDQGSWAAVIWRHPKLQQKEWGDINDMHSGIGSVDMSGGSSSSGGSEGSGSSSNTQQQQQQQQQQSTQLSAIEYYKGTNVKVVDNRVTTTTAAPKVDTNAINASFITPISNLFDINKICLTIKELLATI